MKLQIARWGNSAALRLPKSVLEELRVGPHGEFEAWVHGGELHLRPVAQAMSYRLQELLEQITPDNIPPFEDWPSVGGEIIADDFSR